MLGPSGTGKSVFLKTLIGLLKPDRGSIVIDGIDIASCSEKELYEIRKLFGVLFQDGALFGSMNLYDNVAFPLREHTKKSESEIRDIVMEKMDMVGLLGAENKLPGEISGGMRKRAGLARALVLDPEIILFDEPDSGLDPVRTAYLNQLIVDLNAQIDATFLIVTHDINTARTVPDNIGLLYHRHLVMFGPREMLLTSEEPVVRQFLNGQRDGPIGMSEEKDADELEAEKGAGPARRCRRSRSSSSPPTASPAAASASRVAGAVRTAWTPPPGLLRGEACRWLPEPARRGGTHRDGFHDCHAGPRADRDRRQALRLRPRRRPRAVPAAVPDPRVHRAGLVHRQRHDHPDRARRHPVRRGHRAAARAA